MADTLNLEAERTAFEKTFKLDQWQKRPHAVIDGDYADQPTQCAWNGWLTRARRASPAAAVPENALPKGWEARIAERHPTSEAQYWPVDLKAKYMEAEIAEWRARAAVEADRAQRPTTPTVQVLQAALAAALDTDDVSADRAQQGEPVDESAAFENYFCMTLSDDGSESAELVEACRVAACDAWMERARRAATKAAAPADASSQQQEKVVRVAPAPAGQHDASDAAHWRELLECVMAEMPHRSTRDDGNAPGHGHSIPGIWDSDNGAKAGKECAWCKVWNAARKAIESGVEMPSRAQRTTIDNENCRAAPVPDTGTPTAGAVEGWKWVPLEPTDEMREACRVLNYCDDIDAEWARMLAAAPQPPEAKAGELDQIIAEHRIAITPENEGGFHAHVYLDSEVPQTKGYGPTPRAAIVAALAQTCTYPKCNCPFDAPSDPNWCARGLARPPEAKAGREA